MVTSRIFRHSIYRSSVRMKFLKLSVIFSLENIEQMGHLEQPSLQTECLVFDRVWTFDVAVATNGQSVPLCNFVESASCSPEMLLRAPDHQRWRSKGLHSEQLVVGYLMRNQTNINVPIFESHGG